MVIYFGIYFHRGESMAYICSDKNLSMVRNEVGPSTNFTLLPRWCYTLSPLVSIFQLQVNLDVNFYFIIYLPNSCYCYVSIAEYIFICLPAISYIVLTYSSFIWGTDSSTCLSVKGLGLIPGVVGRFDSSKGIRVPHIGWNALDIAKDTQILDDIGKSHVYFVHSYRATPVLLFIA